MASALEIAHTDSTEVIPRVMLSMMIRSSSSSRACRGLEVLARRADLYIHGGLRSIAIRVQGKRLAVSGLLWLDWMGEGTEERAIIHYQYSYECTAARQHSFGNSVCIFLLALCSYYVVVSRDRLNHLGCRHATTTAHQTERELQSTTAATAVQRIYRF